MLPHRSTISLIGSYAEHPCFGTYNSVSHYSISIDVIRMKSYVDGFFEPSEGQGL